MNGLKTKRKRKILVTVLAVLLVGTTTFPLWYTSAALASARNKGVYATPEDGVIANANARYCAVERVRINQAGTNSLDGSDPHVWYVIWTVYAQNHIPCDPENPGEPLTYGTWERGGQFYLNVKDGWVMMPEGLFPMFIGEWMKILNLAGPGDPTTVIRYSHE